MKNQAQMNAWMLLKKNDGDLCFVCHYNGRIWGSKCIALYAFINILVITFIVAIWALSFSCRLIHLPKISWNKWWSISLYKQCLSKENAVLIQTSVIFLPLHCEQAELCHQAVRAAQRFILSGGGVKLQVLLTVWWSNSVTKFSDKLFWMLFIG